MRKKSEEIQKSDTRKRSNTTWFTEIYEALSHILRQLEKASKLSLDIYCRAVKINAWPWRPKAILLICLLILPSCHHLVCFIHENEPKFNFHKNQHCPIDC